MGSYILRTSFVLPMYTLQGSKIHRWGAIVEGRFDGEGAKIGGVRIDHGGLYILMAEEFLDGSNVVAVLKEMGGEGMPEGMRGDVFVYFSKSFC